jgi:hypothetical protein
MSTKPVTVRLSAASHQRLRRLASETGEPMTSVLDKAIDIYERKRFLEGVNADFAALRNNPELWEEELEERRLWDATLADGLDDE